MSTESTPRGNEERRRFIADPAVLAELGMRVEDLADPEARSLVIRHEHPDLEEALIDGSDVRVGGEKINPRLHLTMHEIVATQLWDDSPTEVWDTAARLLRSGYDRDEILHMLAAPMSAQVWGALHENRPYDEAAHVAALRALPGSWEKQRKVRTLERRHEDARKAARRAAKTSRRRNRRPN